MNDKVKTNSEIAYCGLFCGECGSFKKGKCPGCADNEKASWCKIRTCCKENRLQSCAECKKNGAENCSDYNNIISKAIQFFTGTSRLKCVEYIKKSGYDEFSSFMKQNGIMSMKK